MRPCRACRYGAKAPERERTAGGIAANRALNPLDTLPKPGFPQGGYINATSNDQ
jgi:hypothetical protein